MSESPLAHSLVVFVRGGQVEACVTDAPMQVAVLNYDRAGIPDADLIQLHSLKNKPATWEEVPVEVKPSWVKSLLASTPLEDAPELPPVVPAQNVILPMLGGAVDAGYTDGAVRVMVLDRDPCDPDDLLTFPGERFRDGETFEAAREWPDTRVVPAKVVEAFEEVARLRSARKAGPRSRHSPRT